MRTAADVFMELRDFGYFEGQAEDVLEQAFNHAVPE
jgi:hypothetical protein